ncbi:MAG: carboxymuconolactone decarboxylase family protein [Candidatus Binatia bacterium]
MLEQQAARVRHRRDTGENAMSETWIPYVREEDFPEDLVPALAYYKSRMNGVLPNAIKAYLHRPHIAQAFIALNNAIMRDPGNTLSEEFKRHIGIVVSRANGCAYCTSHHAAVLKEKGAHTDEQLACVLSIDESLSDREKAALRFAREATLGDHTPSAQTKAALAKHFTPSEIVEIACCIGLWNFTNHVHDALGMPVEEPMAGETHWATDSATEVAARKRRGA